MIDELVPVDPILTAALVRVRQAMEGDKVETPVAILGRARAILMELQRLGDYDVNARPLREAFELIMALAEHISAQDAQMRARIAEALDKPKGKK